MYFYNKKISELFYDIHIYMSKRTLYIYIYVQQEHVRK